MLPVHYVVVRLTIRSGRQVTVRRRDREVCQKITRTKTKSCGAGNADRKRYGNLSRDVAEV